MSMAGMPWARRSAAILLGAVVRMWKLVCSFHTCLMAILHPYSATQAAAILHSGRHELDFSIAMPLSMTSTLPLRLCTVEYMMTCTVP